MNLAIGISKLSVLAELESVAEVPGQKRVGNPSTREA